MSLFEEIVAEEMEITLAIKQANIKRAEIELRRQKGETIDLSEEDVLRCFRRGIIRRYGRDFENLV